MVSEQRPEGNEEANREGIWGSWVCAWRVRGATGSLERGGSAGLTGHGEDLGLRSEVEGCCESDKI